ncbi:MAG TPA: sigma-70 family RNA polymerase sigma factor, partial [Symbiobacteriaceae bacterium]|nr:sigma-70 family RNA polymerase sigma factor [Symbiobacteriaceae bacterium]
MDRLLEPARRGDEQARNDLIRQYTPLVLRVGSQVSGRYLQVGRDEEVSIGMIALNEAIDRFDADRGASFISFAEMVIKRRLIDYYRRQKGRSEIPMSELESEDDEGNVLQHVEQREAISRFSQER